MRVLIGGGTGFIGRNLVKHLKKSNYEVIIVTRKPEKKNEISWAKIESSGIPEDVQAVLNLSGRSIDQPLGYFSKSYVKELFDSRVGTNKTLVKAIREMKKPPQLFLSMSGVGYYPPSKTEVYDENGPNGTDWMAKLAKDWEAAAQLPMSLPVRRVIIRSGVVLGADGGIVKNLLPVRNVFRPGLGTGTQYFPWIHVTDMVRLIQFIIENERLKGEFNGVAPQCITYETFSKSLCQKEAIGFSLPSPIVELLYGKDLSVVLLEGQNVIPHRAQNAGFSFKFSTIDDAVKDILSRK